MNAAQVQAIAAGLPRFFDALVSARQLAIRAVAIATALDHPVYDALYLALAETEQACLVTADDRLLAKIQGTPWEGRATSLSTYGSTSASVRPDVEGPGGGER
jgi:predicted nucleic acid-binding protein